MHFRRPASVVRLVDPSFPYVMTDAASTRAGMPQV
jgi:hypothetical protein